LRPFKICRHAGGFTRYTGAWSCDVTGKFTCDIDEKFPFPATRPGSRLAGDYDLPGITVGPTLGGWLSEAISWRAVFYINVPIGILALYLSYRYILPDKKSSNQEGFDLGGALLFLTGLVALLIGLNQGHAIGWLLAANNRRSEHRCDSYGVFLAPGKTIKDLSNAGSSLFKQARFRSSVISAILNYICCV